MIKKVGIFSVFLISLSLLLILVPSIEFLTISIFISTIGIVSFYIFLKKLSSLYKDDEIFRSFKKGTITIFFFMFFIDIIIYLISIYFPNFISLNSTLLIILPVINGIAFLYGAYLIKKSFDRIYLNSFIKSFKISGTVFFYGTLLGITTSELFYFLLLFSSRNENITLGKLVLMVILPFYLIFILIITGLISLGFLFYGILKLPSNQ